MFKKMLAFILSTVLFLSLVPVQAEASFPPVAKEDIKVGAIFIGPKDDGFTGAHYNGVEGMKKTVAVVATSDESAMMRRRAASREGESLTNSTSTD